MLSLYLWEEQPANQTTIRKTNLENTMNEHLLKKTEYRDKQHSVRIRLTYMKFITVIITVVIESYEDNEY